MTEGARRIAAERQRQIGVEGWTPEHDDQHSNGELFAKHDHPPNVLYSPTCAACCAEWDAAMDEQVVTFDDAAGGDHGG